MAWDGIDRVDSRYSVDSIASIDGMAGVDSTDNIG